MVDVKSLKRVFDILDLFQEESFELGVSEISRKLKMNKSTVSRLMANLETAGYLSKSAANRKYRLGRKVAQLAFVFFVNIDLKSIVMPHIKELNQKTNELIVIHVLEGDGRNNIAYIESNHPVRRVMGTEGSPGPLHAGAPGKLLLAYLPDDIIDQILKRTGLPRFTDNTITSKKDLLKEIKDIRERGIATSNGEHIELLSTAAAPIRNYTGQVVAALSISWVSRPDDGHIRQKYADLAKECAENISKDLGFIRKGEDRKVSKVATYA
jgi:DNA-binding IclR family transcriptional regulator